MTCGDEKQTLFSPTDLWEVDTFEDISKDPEYYLEGSFRKGARQVNLIPHRPGQPTQPKFHSLNKREALHLISFLARFCVSK